MNRQQQLDRPREYCGLFGVFGVPEAARQIYAGLFALQHRGQEGAGIVVSDGDRVRSQKGTGLVCEACPRKSLTGLKGHLGIGHVRYSTTGSSRPQNVQPLVVECLDGIWAHRPQRQPPERARPAPLLPGGGRHLPDQHRQRDPGSPDRRPHVPLPPAPGGTGLERTQGRLFLPPHDQGCRHGSARPVRVPPPLHRPAGRGVRVRQRDLRPGTARRGVSSGTCCPANW